MMLSLSLDFKMTSSRVIIVLLTIASLNIASGEESDGDSDLLYNTAKFEEVVGTTDHFVKFFAPWCGHCKRLAPVWSQLSDKYNKPENSVVTIAKVDCTEDTKLCSDHGVTGYPTLKFFPAEKDSIKYKGKRDFDTLDKYIEEQVKQKDSGVPQPPAAKHGLYELTEKTFKEHVATGSHFVKFYAPWCGHCKRLAPAWEQLAQGFQHSDGVTIAKVDCTAHRAVCEQFGIKGYPTLKFITNGEEADSYNGARDHGALKEYVSKMLRQGGAPTGGAAPSPVQQKKAEPPAPIDPTTDSKVVILGAENFEEQIAAGISFVKFYAPWCPHCQKLVSVWDELAKKFSKQQGVTVGKVDCTVEKDLCQKYKVEGYPTLLLFQDGKKIDMHSGSRNIEALETYIKSKLPKEEL